jgi:hypothetical protein
MDLVPDGGVVWRRRIQTDLADLGVHWLDPTNKPCRNAIEDSEDREIRQRQEERGEWGAVSQSMEEIHRIDLRLVDISDFVVVYLDKNNSGCGTFFEISRANIQRKPIIVMAEGGKQNAPDWMFGLGISDVIFGDWGELYHYLRSINGDCFYNHMGRWVFFDWMGVEPITNFAIQAEGARLRDLDKFCDSSLGEPYEGMNLQ